MKYLTYCIVCYILFVACTKRENDNKLQTTLKYIVGGICLLCLTLLSIF